MKLADLWIKLGLKKDGFDKGLDQAKSKTTSFGSVVKKIGGYLAGAFAVERIISFGKELLELGGIAEGVRAAFKRIGGEEYLIDLKNATKGTVSELELMKRAVMASNFQIPIENLADLFKFATKRAQETGESVDYLVNSIVLGIGRKSPLILDNLGISAVRLRQELKGAGVELNSVQDIAAAVGRIAAEEMKKSGDIIETNAIKLQSLTASWQDFKTTLATNPGVQTFMGKLLQEAQEFINITTKFQTTEQVNKQKKAEEEASKSRAQRIKAEIELNKLFGKSINDLTNEEMEAAKKAGEAQWKAYYEGQKARASYLDALKQSLSDTKAELDKLMKTGGKWHGEQSAEDFIKKIDELNSKIDATSLKIADLTGTRRITSGQVSKLESIGLSGNEFTAPVPDTSSLMPLDNFISQLRDRYANLIDDETLRRMKEKFDEAEEASIQFTESIKSALISSLQGLGTAIGEALAGGGWDNFGKAILQIIGGFMQTLGAAIIAIGIGLLKLNASLATANPFGVIAAGIALTAAGAALSSIVSGGIKGTSSGGASASGYSSSGSSASYAISGNVNFVLEGNKLIGAINNNNRRRSITG